MAAITRGDPRRVEVHSGSAAAVLRLGPHSHLVKRSGRLRALGEACRILKPGGVLFVAVISRFASLIDGLSRGLF